MKNLIKIFLCLSFLFICTVYAQDKFECRKLTSDTERKGFPSWSPDGKSIVYQVTNHNDTHGKNGLWIISNNGTNAKQIFRGIAEHPKWSPDNKFIVFDADSGRQINLIPAEGGDVNSFLPDSIQIRNGGLPCWSPDASQIAFLERNDSSLCIYNIKTGIVQSIFSRDGMLPLPGCFTTDGKHILIALLDMQSRKSSIQKISITDGIAKPVIIDNENFYRHLAVSPDGSIIIFAALEDKYLGLFITLEEGGKSIPLTVTPDFHNESPSWSPDGKSIIFTSGRSGGGIWIMDVEIEQLRKEFQEINK